MSPTNFKKQKQPNGRTHLILQSNYSDKGTVVRLKLGDIKAKTKSLMNERLVHL